MQPTNTPNQNNQTNKNTIEFDDYSPHSYEMAKAINKKKRFERFNNKSYHNSIIKPVPRFTNDQINNLHGFFGEVKPLLNNSAAAASWLKPNGLLIDPTTGVRDDRRRIEHTSINALLNRAKQDPKRYADIFMRANYLLRTGVKENERKDGTKFCTPIYGLTEGFIPYSMKTECRRFEVAADLGLLFLLRGDHGYIVTNDVVRFTIDIDSNGINPLTLEQMITRCSPFHPWLITCTSYGSFHIVVQGDRSLLNMNYRLAMACMFMGEDPSDFNIDLRNKDLTSRDIEDILVHLNNHHCVDRNYIVTGAEHQVFRPPHSYNFNQDCFTEGGFQDKTWVWTQKRIDGWLNDCYESNKATKSSTIQLPVMSNVLRPAFKPPVQDLPVIQDLPASIPVAVAAKVELSDEILSDVNDANNPKVDLLVAALSVPELSLMKRFVRPFAEYIIKGLGWMLENEPTYSIPQVETSGMVGCSQPYMSKILKKLVEIGYFIRDKNWCVGVKTKYYCFGDRLRCIDFDHISRSQYINDIEKGKIPKGSLSEILKREYELGESNEGILRDIRIKFSLGAFRSQVEEFIIGKYFKYVDEKHPACVRSISSLVCAVKNWISKKDRVKKVQGQNSNPSFSTA